MATVSEHVVRLIKDKYPDCEVIGIVPFKGKYIASISFSDDDPELKMANFHEVNLETGKVSGNIPTLSLTLDPDFIDTLSEHGLLKK